MSGPALGALIASGNVAEVFAYGPKVVKLYKSSAPKRSAFREAAILAVVETFDLPVPHVHGVQQFGDRWGVLMDRVEGSSFGVAMAREPDLLPVYLDAMAHLHLRLHRNAGTQLSSLKARLAGDIGRATMLGKIRQTDLLHDLAALPDGDRLCHGDFTR